MAGDASRNAEKERRADFYNQPWVEDAVIRYLNRKPSGVNEAPNATSWDISGLEQQVLVFQPLHLGPVKLFVELKRKAEFKSQLVALFCDYVNYI